MVGVLVYLLIGLVWACIVAGVCESRRASWDLGPYLDDYVFYAACWFLWPLLLPSLVALQLGKLIAIGMGKIFD